MSRRAPLLAATVALCLAAAGGTVTSPQDDRREVLDGVSFVAPVGWTRESAGGIVGLQAPASVDGEAGAAQIALLPVRPVERSAVEEFRHDWTRTVASGYGLAAPPDVATELAPNGWITVTGVATLPHAHADVQVLLMTAIDERRVVSIVASFAGAAHRRAIERFFAELRLDRSGNAGDPGSVTPAVGDHGGAAATTVEDPKGSSALPGGFGDRGPTRLWFRLHATVGSSARMEARTLDFQPDGRLLRVFPFGARNDPSRCSPDTCGRYRLAGDALTVRWDDGRTERWPYVRRGDEVVIDGVTFRAARAVPARELIGEWVAPGGGFANVYGFRADGTFTSGAGTAMLGGRYRVAGLELTLTYDDGDRRRLALFAAGGASPATTIVVENEAYARR